MFAGGSIAELAYALARNPAALSPGEVVLDSAAQLTTSPARRASGEETIAGVDSSLVTSPGLRAASGEVNVLSSARLAASPSLLRHKYLHLLGAASSRKVYVAEMQVRRFR